jgi:hypothetical protein
MVPAVVLGSPIMHPQNNNIQWKANGMQCVDEGKHQARVVSSVI